MLHDDVGTEEYHSQGVNGLHGWGKGGQEGEKASAMYMVSTTWTSEEKSAHKSGGVMVRKQQ